MLFCISTETSPSTVISSTVIPVLYVFQFLGLGEVRVSWGEHWSPEGCMALLCECVPERPFDRARALEHDDLVQQRANEI